MVRSTVMHRPHCYGYCLSIDIRLSTSEPGTYGCVVQLLVIVLYEECDQCFTAVASNRINAIANAADVIFQYIEYQSSNYCEERQKEL